MQVQTQDQLTWSTDKCQLAAKTPLGWVIMGQPAKSTQPLSKTSQRDSVALWQQAQPKPIHKSKIKSPSTKPLPQSDNSTNTEERILPSDAQANQFAQQYSEENCQLAKDLQGRKEDELPGYSQDEITFLNKVLRNKTTPRMKQHSQSKYSETYGPAGSCKGRYGM